MKKLCVVTRNPVNVMAAQRRKWQETLRNKCDTEKNSKKPKINILEDRVYKEENGKLVLQTKTIYPNENENGIDKEQFPDSMTLIQRKNTTSPHQNPLNVENLTPTFRKPEIYLAEAAEIMKEISPKSEQINTSIEDNIINIDKIKHDFLYSGIQLNLAEEEFSVTETDETDKLLRKESPIQGVLYEENCLKATNECDSPNWANCETYNNIEVTIEHNSEIDSNEILDGDAKKSLESESDEKQTSDEKVFKEKVNIDTGNKITTKKILNDIKMQGAVFVDTSDDIRPAYDTDLAKSEEEKNKKIVRRSKRKLCFDKSYLDFVEDDPDTILLNNAFPSEESSLELSEKEASTSSDAEKNESKRGKQKKKILKKKQKKSQKIVKKGHELSAEKRKSKAEIKKENYEKKKKGKSYINTKGEIIESKCVKPNPCIGVQCGNNCGNVPEDRRLNIFNHFWGLNSYQRRRDWIVQCAIRKSIKRPSKNAVSNRSQSYEYYINEGEGRRKVCQKFLIATLDVTQRFMLYTLDTMIDGFAKEDGRGSAGGRDKTSDDVIQDAKIFILDLPLLPSHYCRRDSTKLYLPEEFKNVSKLYRIYQDHYAGKKIMSFKVFSGWFRKTLNIGFHVPKKDKCTLCVSSKNFDVKTREEMEKLKQHENEKEESYKRFIFHQKLNSMDKGTICASFDLQKVLNTPYGESMTLYYSRKIAVYNFTIYESNTQLGICNLWTEADAKRGANEIATCLLEYIKNVDKRGNVKQIILYCDSVFGQNKNKTVLAMLRYALSISDNIAIIQINYLIPGHTYMPVNSMHATIETSVKNSIVWAPSQWPTIIQFARKNPQPYVVNVLNGEDFSGFENIVEHTFKKTQKIQISKISIVTFRKKQPEKMFVKNSMLPDAEVNEVTLSALNNNANPKQKLYPSKLPICQKKYSDLKKLVDKLVIPKRFAKEYLDLKTNPKVKDCLPGTDDEDDC